MINIIFSVFFYIAIGFVFYILLKRKCFFSLSVFGLYTLFNLFIFVNVSLTESFFWGVVTTSMSLLFWSWLFLLFFVPALLFDFWRTKRINIQNFMKIFKKFYFWLPVVFSISSLMIFLLDKNSNDLGSYPLHLIIINIINPSHWLHIDFYDLVFKNFDGYDFDFKFAISSVVGVLIWFLIGLLIDKIIGKFRKSNS